MNVRMAALGTVVIAACGPAAPTVAFVTIDARPAVPRVATLRIAVHNAGATRSQEFPVGGTFPQTLSVTPSGRSGSLSIDVVALDAAGWVVAHGRAAGIITPDARIDLPVTLDPDDFLVNEVVTGDQRLDYTGRQASVLPDNQVLFMWRTETGLFGRIFDETGLPAFNASTNSDGDFEISPATASWQAASLVSSDTVALALLPDTSQVLVRTFGAKGQPSAPIQVADHFVDAPTAFAVGSSFGGLWVDGTSLVLRLLAANGAPEGDPVSVATDDAGFPGGFAGTDISDSNQVVAWGGDDLSLRLFSNASTLGAAFRTGARGKVHVLGAARTSMGFALLFHEAWLSGGPLTVQHFAVNGQPTTSPIQITATAPSFVVASFAVSNDGSMLVVWDELLADDDDYGIRARLFHPSGMPSGEPFVVNTTSLGRQTNPSVVAVDDTFVVVWMDESGLAPAPSPAAVKARFLYPTLDHTAGSTGSFRDVSQ